MPKQNVIKRRRRVQRRGTLEHVTMPPKIQATIQSSHVFRYAASGALSSRAVAGYDLLGMVGVATSATGVSSILAGVRIKRVDLWVPASQSSQNTLNINWVGSTFQRPERFVDSAINSAIPGHISSRPPAGSDASQWIGYAQRNTTYFTVDGPTATVMDVSVEIVLNNSQLLGGAGGIPTYTSSGLTSGTLYFGPLDKNTGSPTLIPVGMAYYG